MTKTIILGLSNKVNTDRISIRVRFWLANSIGLIYFVLGTIKYYNSGSSFESWGWIILGVFFIIFGIIMFSNTPLTPKFKIDDNKLEFKNKIISKPVTLFWRKIQSIKFAPYEITFQLESTDKIISYSSSPTSSIEIKTSIREVAESKNIPIVGG